jgi:hypothetical protein
MRRFAAILAASLFFCAATFSGSYFLARRVSVARLSNPADDLEWLREEFKLEPAEMARVRQLHEGYLPRCAVYCRKIAEKKREIAITLAGTTNLTANASQKLLERQLVELGELRAHCQAEMFIHFQDVSEAMPPDQGRRYLAVMRQLVLGNHEQIEQSMGSMEGEHGQR